jgi:hypothetical protein
MYYSTFHWQKLLNGYSGFFPPSYLQLLGAMRGFPDARSLAALRARGAGYALIHGELLEPQAYQQVIGEIDSCRCGLTLVARRPWQGREISLYKIESAHRTVSGLDFGLAGRDPRACVLLPGHGSIPHVPLRVIRPSARSPIARKNRRNISSRLLMASFSAAPIPGGR